MGKLTPQEHAALEACRVYGAARAEQERLRTAPTDDPTRPAWSLACENTQRALVVMITAATALSVEAA